MKLRVTKHREFDMNPLASNPASYSVLKEAADILTPKGMWIGAGTLLGLWRDKRLIPHDTDIDFMLIGSKGAATPTLPPAFEPIRSIDLGPLPMQRAYIKDGVIVDLAFFWEGIDPEHAIHQHDAGRFRLRPDLVEPTIYAHVNDIHMLIPNSPDKW